MKYLIILSVFLISLVPVNGQSIEKKHQVVVQMSTDDIDAQKALMNNLESLKKGWGNAVDIEVVAHGPGISLLLKDKSPVAAAVKKMIASGIVFVACENTMTKKNIAKEQLLEGVGTVPMGLGEIILKQEQGWSYIKAGF